MSLVDVALKGPVAVVTLNHPETYNALTWELMAALDQAVAEAARSSQVRCLLLTGAGRGFCSGATLSGGDLAKTAEIDALMRSRLNPLLARLRSCRIPIVAAVNGPAAGAGVGLALLADIVIAARTAQFVLSFVKIGAVLDAGTSALLQRSIGAARTRAMALLGEPLGATEAQDAGLIWKAVAPEDLFAEAMTVAERLAAGPAQALSLIRRQLDDAWSASLPATLDCEAEMQARAFASADLREGVAAFVERRPPRFTGA